VFVGGAGADTLVGYGGTDMMWGEDGDDLLLGGAGNDQLMGGFGSDRLIGHAGTDKFWGEAGNDVVISIDAALGEYVDGGAGVDTLWVDRVGSSRDGVAGLMAEDMLQEVSSFANGADRTLDGDRIADPLPLAGQAYKTFANNPLFSSAGPQMTDIRQGELGDCWALAAFSAIARDNPQALRHNVVDFADGTYGVRLGNNFYRVDNDLPVGRTGAPANAQLGPQNSMWVAVLEKAFAHYRTGANSYASLDGGWSVEVNRAFRSASPGARQIESYSNATALVNDIAYGVATGQAVTVGFLSDRFGRAIPAGGARLVMGHMYTVASVQRNAAGAVVSITLRNPWGVDGVSTADANPNDGFVTVTPAQLYAHLGQVNWGRV
jgi:hypothetical protein